MKASWGEQAITVIDGSRRAGVQTCCGAPSLVRRFFFWPLVGFLQILAGFFQRAEGVVVGLQGLAIFVHGALALAGNVENLAQLQVAPDFGPARVAVAVERLAVGVGGGLKI